MNNYSIGEFAKQIGVSIQTLRDWHKKGELMPSHITTEGEKPTTSGVGWIAKL